MAKKKTRPKSASFVSPASGRPGFLPAGGRRYKLLLRFLIFFGINREEIGFEALAPAFGDFFAEGLEQFVALSGRKLRPRGHCVVDDGGVGGAGGSAAAQLGILQP